MFIVFCPHCHTPLDPLELEEAAADIGRHLVCPECDEPIPVLADTPSSADAGHPEDEPNA